MMTEITTERPKIHFVKHVPQELPMWCKFGKNKEQGICCLRVFISMPINYPI